MTPDDGAVRGRAAAARAVGLTALSAPVVVVAHLLTTGTPPPLPAVVAVALTAALLGAVVPARGTRRMALLVGLSQLAGHGVLALAAGSSPTQGCLPAVGRGARLGIEVAFLGEPGCPPGTYAAGVLTHAALTALLTAAALVAGHAVAACAGGMLLAVVEGCRDVVAAVAALVRPRVPAARPLPVPPRRGLARSQVAVPLPQARIPVALSHRGPPVAGLA